MPTWAAAAVNLAFWAYLIWAGVVFYRVAQDKERVIVAGWFTVLLLGPMKYLVSSSAAAAILYIETLGMVVAFFAAMDILLRCHIDLPGNAMRPPRED